MVNIGPTGESVRENQKKDRADSECVGLMPIPFWPAAGINGLRTVDGWHGGRPCSGRFIKEGYAQFYRRSGFVFVRALRR